MERLKRLIRPFFATRRRAFATVTVIIAAAIPLLLLAGWLIRPLFVDTVVDESFPLSTDAVLPEGMTQDEARVMMSAATKLENEVSETMTEAMTAATEVKTGRFVDGDAFHKGSGTATLYQLEDGSYVLRFEDFQVTNGPDLRVLVSPHPNPQSRGDISDAGYIELDKLKGNVGNQNYFFPEGEDPANYNSVIIYCKPFRVVFSVAALDAN